MEALCFNGSMELTIVRKFALEMIILSRMKQRHHFNKRVFGQEWDDINASYYCAHLQEKLSYCKF